MATRSEIQIVPDVMGFFIGLNFSRDGNYVYYVLVKADAEAGDLFRVPTLGGQPRKIAGGVDSPVSFSPDGNQFAFLRQTASSGNALFVRSIDNAAEKKLAERQAPEDFSLYGLAWSPDGKQLAVGAYAGGKCQVMTVPAGGGQLRPISQEGWAHLRQLAWLADSSGIVVDRAAVA